MLSADLHVTRYFRLFVEGKSSLATDRDLQGENSNGFVDEIDLQNAFADVMIPFGDPGSLTLRGGRQELLFGAQRLVSPLDWSNVRRTFDGGLGILKLGDWTATPFWASLVTVRQYEFNEFSDDKQLFGVYATGPVPGLPLRGDLYWLAAHNETATLQRHGPAASGGTPWGPGLGKVGDAGIDYELEAAVQVGTVGDADVLAGMVTANVGYALPLPVPAAPTSTSTTPAATERPAGTWGRSTSSTPWATASSATWTTSAGRTS